MRFRSAANAPWPPLCIAIPLDCLQEPARGREIPVRFERLVYGFLRETIVLQHVLVPWLQSALLLLKREPNLHFVDGHRLKWPLDLFRNHVNNVHSRLRMIASVSYFPCIITYLC